MKIFSWNDIISEEKQNELKDFFSSGSGISIGSFDGLHQGHRILLSKLVEGSKKRNLLSGVVSFVRPLPSLKHSKDYQGDLTTLNQRIDLFNSIGLDFVIVVDFTEEFASMTGVQFLQILVEKCSLKFIAEGIDFRFGYKGSTDITGIQYFAKEHSMEYEFVEPVFYRPGTDEEERISSSYIRTMVLKRFFSTATELLTRPYSMELMFKSDNLEVELKNTVQAIPPIGIYKCKCNGDDVRVEVTKTKMLFKFDQTKNIPEINKNFIIEFL